MPRILCAALILCLLSGCSSKELNDKTVRKVVQTRFDREIASVPVQMGRISSHCQRDDNGKLENVDLSPDKRSGIMVAQIAGYITVAPDGPDYWRVSLTDKGKNAPSGQLPEFPVIHGTLNGCDYQIYRFALAHPHVTGVGQIASAGETGSASVAWKWTPTELGRSLEKDGDIYSKLTPAQRSQINDSFFSPRLLVPMPLPMEENEAPVKFKRGEDGQWTMVERTE